jgi:hypothetical protein
MTQYHKHVAFSGNSTESYIFECSGTETRFSYPESKVVVGVFDSTVDQIRLMRTGRSGVSSWESSDLEYTITHDEVIFTQPPPVGYSIRIDVAMKKDAIAEIGYEAANDIVTEYLRDQEKITNSPSLQRAWKNFQAIKDLV